MASTTNPDVNNNEQFLAWILTHSLQDAVSTAPEIVPDLLEGYNNAWCDHCTAERSDPETTGYEIKEDGLWVEITYIGEGYSGDYDPADFSDRPLARFYVMHLVDGEWQDIDSASYCTQLPADNYEGMVKLARLILDRAGDELRKDGSYKHILEELSYFSGEKKQ